MSRRWVSLLCRVVGIVAILHASLGLILGASSMLLVPRTDFSEFDTEDIIRELPPKYPTAEIPEEVLSFSLSDPKTSATFFSFFYAMCVFGLGFNVLLGWIGYRLLRGHSRAGWPFLALMIVYAVYTNVARLIPTDSTAWGLSFASAWGVGNVGVSTMLVSRFWLWGPALIMALLLAARRTPKRPNDPRSF